ncbi:MAG: hypothetical protein WD096_11030 [Actinomycetota bacterium]
MANERKTPLSETAPSTRERSRKTDARSKAIRRRAIVGGVVAVAALGGITYLLTGGDTINPIDVLVDPGPPTPTFAFDSVKVDVESTTATSKEDLTDTAEEGAHEAQAVLTDLVQGAFVDPDTWGDYDGVFSRAMTDDAAAKAVREADALTLGVTANADYEFVTPEHGKLRLQILTDAEDRPAQASALLTFRATAELADGTFTTLTSKGTYLLRVVDGRWRIFSFDVTRKEVAAEAPASVTPSAGASP